MSKIRTIRRIVKGQNVTDGAGMKLVRVFENSDVVEFDPFLMLDAYDSVNPNDYIKGFPWHPHRGMETITYLIKGNIEHVDSLGNSCSVLDGGCQWMTAGSGIIHQEMPKAKPRMLGAQIWLNMPAKDKMSPPKYGDISRKSIPVVRDGDAVVHLISGSLKGTHGAMEGDYIKPVYFDVELKPRGKWLFETDPELNLFIYIVLGAGSFDPEENREIREKHAVLFENGNILRVKASEEGMRFLLLAGKPLKEPIAWGGPIVMNTEDELEQAFIELNENTFIKRHNREIK